MPEVESSRVPYTVEDTDEAALDFAGHRDCMRPTPLIPEEELDGEHREKSVRLDRFA